MNNQESNSVYKSNLLSTRVEGNVCYIQLTRPSKRNAISEQMLHEIKLVFSEMSRSVGVAVLYAEGDHFCSGLDLSEVGTRSTIDVVNNSRLWHEAFDAIQFGRVPVIGVLKGAVIGGGLELAGACHIRVAEKSTFYALPEATRGLFLGGGGSVRISRILGMARITDLMLTGRVYNADEGLAAGLSQYIVSSERGLEKATEIARVISSNSKTSNFAVTHVLPRIMDQSIQDGLVTESLMAAIASADPQTADRLANFLEKRAHRLNAE
jgi:(methylthio)acryloyl-CoA hydratase